MNPDRFSVREILGYASLVLFIFSIELLIINATGTRHLMITGNQLLLAVLVLVGVVSVLVLFDGYLVRKSSVSRFFWYALAVVVLFFKAEQAGLFRGYLMPWVFLTGILIGYFLPLPRPRREGLSLFLVLVVLQSGWIKYVHIHKILPSSLVLLMACGLFVAVIALLWAFERYGVRGGSVTRGLVSAVALGLLLVALGQWFWLDRGFPLGTHFSGTLPEVHSQGSPEDLPNIIVIGVDDLRWDMVPPRAPDELSLSALERLRRDGIEFTRAFSPASSTPHAFASFFSGLLPVRHGTLQGIRIHPSVWLYPQLLQRAGYRTAGFVGGGFVSRDLGFSRGYDRYWEYPNLYGGPIPGVFQVANLLLPGSKRMFYQEAATEACFCHTLSKGLDWIGGGEDPFYLFLHTYQVHDYAHPYPEALTMLRERHPELLAAPGVKKLIDPLRFRGMKDMQALLPELVPRLTDQDGRHFGYLYRNQPPDRRAFLKKFVDKELNPQLERYALSGLSVREAEQRVRGYVLHWWTILKHLYMYNVELTDRHLADFLSELEDRGLYEDSLIVFMSDHGEGFMVDSTSVGHGGQLHEMLIRVPLYIKLPGNEPSDRQVSELVQLTDVFPSVFRRIGLRPEVPTETYPDTPVRGLLTPGDPRDRSVVRGSTTVGHYVRGQDVKYIDRPDTKDPLLKEGWFRVDNERIGQTQVEAGAIPEAVRAELRTEMARMVSVLERENLRDDFTMDRALREELKGLGYLR